MTEISAHFQNQKSNLLEHKDNNMIMINECYDMRL